MSNSDQVVRTSILQAIGHRNEERRKMGRSQLLKLIRDQYTLESEENIQLIIDLFRQKYIKSSDLNRKIVGLESMVTILNAIQYNKEIQAKFESVIIGNILQCLMDNQSRIRSITFEKIFEILQLFRSDFMRMFNQIFEKIIGCINDTEQMVKNSCEFVDRKMKDTFNENYNNPDFDINQLVSIIKSKIKTLNIEVRRYLIGWINQFLQLDLIVHVGQFLEDLLMMSSNNQIQNNVYECMGNFEMVMKQKFYDKSLQREVSINFINELFTNLIKVANSKCPSKTKLQTLKWFKLFFVFFSQQVQIDIPKVGQKFYFKKIVIERFDEILEPILLLMSHEEEQVRKESIYVNEILKDSIQKVDKETPINIIKIVPLLKEALSEKKATNTSQYALNWMKFMLQNYQGKIIPGMMEIVSQVMEKIYEGSAKNIYEIIQIMKSKEDYFELMIEKMLQFLNNKIWEQQDRTEIMLKKFVNPKDIALLWTSVCKHIETYLDQSLFMYQIASSLNSIIIHEANMKTVRYFLTNWAAPNYLMYYLRMFKILKYNPPAALSLCFLSQQYELAYKIIGTLTGKRQINSKVLLGLCKLVSQLQSPAFVSLRMHILQQDDEYLMQSLYSLLMILPQGKIFNMLRKRLDSGGIIDKDSKIHIIKKHSHLKNPINIDQLFDDYKKVYGLK